MPIKPTYHYSLSDVDVDVGRVSLLSRCRILASAELSGCIWQHQWQPMPRSRCQNSAAVWGDAAVCWLVNSRWRLSEKICNFLAFNIYRSTQLNENVTTFCFTAYVAFYKCRKWTKSAFAFRSSETFRGGVWYCGWMRFKSPKESYMIWYDMIWYDMMDYINVRPKADV